MTELLWRKNLDRRVHAESVPVVVLRHFFDIRNT